MSCVCGLRTSSRVTRLSTQRCCAPKDEFYDFLKLNEPVEEGKTAEEISIENGNASAGESVPNASRRYINRASYTEPNYRKWPNWDDFMESEFGDLDAELNNDENWVYDARDSIEQRRGFAIWSKRSAKDIQREVKKKIASRQLNIPESVNSLITSVYFDRTYTLKQIKKEQELTAIEYRKWMIETKGKLKKDPLPVAKVLVAAKWLSQVPSTRASATRRIIMDNYVETDNNERTTFSVGNSGTESSNVLTSSMLNWLKNKADLPILSPKAGSGDVGGAGSTIDKKQVESLVKDEKMFVLSNLVTPGEESQYFIVI